MSMVSISLDTKTRQVVLAIDGQLVPFESLYMDKSIDWDGGTYLAFQYTARSTNPNGLEEIHGYRLPPEDKSEAAKANVHGLVRVPAHDLDKLGKDIAAFMGRGMMKMQMDPETQKRMQKMIQEHQGDAPKQK